MLNLSLGHKLVHIIKLYSSCVWPECERKFIQKSALKSHLRTHTGDKPYPCEWRGFTKRFSQKNVTFHMRTHTGQKPFECDSPGCTSRFAIKSKM